MAGSDTTVTQREDAFSYALGFVLLRRGRQLLPTSPEELARREVELGTAG